MPAVGSDRQAQEAAIPHNRRTIAMSEWNFFRSQLTSKPQVGMSARVGGDAGSGRGS